MKKGGGATLKRKESDDWLCSSTYQPTQREIVQKSDEKQRKAKKLKVVVPKGATIRRASGSFAEKTPKPKKRLEIEGTNDVDILNFVSTSEVKTPTSSLARIQIISPRIPKSVSLRSESSTPVLQTPPNHFFNSQTPRRRKSEDVTVFSVKRRKEDDVEEVHRISSTSEDSDAASDVSNVFDSFSPIKKLEEKIENTQKMPEFSLNFMTGFEAQFTSFEDTQPAAEVLENLNFWSQKDSPDLFDDVDDPMSIYEESEATSSRTQVKIEMETTPEKRDISSEDVKIKKSLRFAENENQVEESCGGGPSLFREFAIDMETCGILDQSTVRPGGMDQDQETQEQRVLKLTPTTENLNDELYDRDELGPLSARFASLMAERASERRILMTDVVFGTTPTDKLVKLDVERFESAFGMSIVGTRQNSNSTVLISRSSAIRRLAPSCSPPPPAPFVCDHAPSAATSPSPSSSISPTTTSIYSIGEALSSSAKKILKTSKILNNEEEILIDVPLVMRRLPLLHLLFLSCFFIHSAYSIRCQCSTSAGGIECHGQWCHVEKNVTHVGACALVRMDRTNAQFMACTRVKIPEIQAEDGTCTYDADRKATACWCTHDDYCNVDLVDLIDNVREMRSSSEEMTVEANQDYDENNNLDSKEPSSSIVPRRIPDELPPEVVDMRKSIETYIPSPEDQSIPPWRRQSAGGSAWKPPPPPPMPGKNPPPTTTTSSTSTTTSTTTTTSPTTTTLSYEERMRLYEEQRRQRELEREMEIRRRADLDRQRLEERRRLESQHDSRRRFEEERVIPKAPEVQTTTTTTTTATTTTTVPRTTTTVPITTTRSTTTTTEKPFIPKVETKTNYEKYYRNWQPHRRPFDLNPTQAISISNLSAIVYPPKNFVKATKPSSTSSTSTSTTTTKTTTTPSTTTTTATTPPIIYPPANFKKASKLPIVTTTSTTSTSTTTRREPEPEPEEVYTLPPLTDDEDFESEEQEEEEPKKQMVEMPKSEMPEETADVVLYTPKPRTIPPPTPSESPTAPSGARTTPEKMKEYKKLMEPSSTSSNFSAFLSTLFSFFVILFLI